ncbi:MAG TPA: phospholipase D-like domain-containing protein, partial [Ottowia sp.]|nr:phospholipase D-like domain-containing protein [Ottowia sp.]
MPLADPMLLGHPWTFWLGWAWTLSSVVLTTWIVLQRRAPVSTLAWIMVLNLMPVLGLVVYHYFGPRRVRRQRLKRWHQKAVLMSQTDLAALNAEHPQAPLWARQHARLIETACGIAPSSARSLELLGSGGATLQALLAEIARARWHIHLEYYIFDPDQTGTQLLHALTERARAGVQVRLLVDAIGSARLLARRQRALLRTLRDAGGELAVFHPRRLDRLRPLVNLRTHRKIVV